MTSIVPADVPEKAMAAMSVATLVKDRASGRRAKALNEYRAMIWATGGDPLKLDIDAIEELTHKINIDRTVTGQGVDGEPIYAEPALDAGGIDSDLAAVATYPAAKAANNDTRKITALREAVVAAVAARDAALEPINEQIATAQADVERFHQVDGGRKHLNTLIYQRQYIDAHDRKVIVDPEGSIDPHTGRVAERRETTEESFARQQQADRDAKERFESKRREKLEALNAAERAIGGPQALVDRMCAARDRIEDLNALAVATRVPYDRAIERAEHALHNAERVQTEALWKCVELAKNNPRVIGAGSPDSTTSAAKAAAVPDFS